MPPPAMPLPSVTVIVPVHNARQSVVPLLDSLARLDYPADRLQVIIVDNGSTDGTPDLVRKYPVELAVETLRGSYAARNRGLQKAGGEIIAFTDADCVADAAWVRRGVEAMNSGHADLVAGNIEFILRRPVRAAEAYDALVHMDNERLVARKRTAVTANLFVRASVFSAVGPFALRRSGADSTFTSAAVQGGFTLVYAAGAIVRHSARGLAEVLRKSWRVGTGFREKMLEQGTPAGVALAALPRVFLPPTPGYIRRLIGRRGTPEMERILPRILVVAYLYGLTWGVSAALSLIGGPRAPRRS